MGDVKTAFTNALREAGIEDFCFHDLRHTAATRLSDVGIHARRIKAILGHQSIQTSDRYTHATDEGLRRDVNALARGPEKEGRVKGWPLKAVNE